LILVNNGSCPGEDIDMLFHVPDGFNVYDEEGQAEPPEEPAPPSPGYASPLFSISDSLLRPHMPQLPQPENPHLPKIRKTNSYEVAFHCNRLKHGFLYRCRALYLAFDSFDAAKSLSFTYNIHAANAAGWHVARNNREADLTIPIELPLKSGDCRKPQACSCDHESHSRVSANCTALLQPPCDDGGIKSDCSSYPD
jgi:hypothetical protein